MLRGDQLLPFADKTVRLYTECIDSRKRSKELITESRALLETSQRLSKESVALVIESHEARQA